MISKAPPTAKQTAARQGRQVGPEQYRSRKPTAAQTAARQGRTGQQLSTAETNQRKKAALASANKRRGTGTKKKNPQTPRTKNNERVRRRSNQDAPKAGGNSKDQVKMALVGIQNALAADEPLRVPAAQLMATVKKLRATGWDVKTRGKRGVSITLKDGRTLKLEAQ